MANSLTEIGQKARLAEVQMRNLTTNEKNAALSKTAESILDKTEEILDANQKDIENAKKNNMKEGLLDRLTLTKERVKAMADGIMSIVSLEDPVGEVLSMKQRPNGLMIGKRKFH